MAKDEGSRVEVDHLVSMANDIAANFSFHDDAISRTADHIRRFWAPRMRSQLQEYIEQGKQGLSKVALAAFDELRKGHEH
jgi:formate dehydrogenase subunit delta